MLSPGSAGITSHPFPAQRNETTRAARLWKRDAQTELQSFVSLIQGPGAAFHREGLKKVQQPLRVDVSTGVMDSDPPNSKCFPRSRQRGFQQPSLC